MGKNTNTKSTDSSSEAGKLEEEGKHDADFYPIPVRTSHKLQSTENKDVTDKVVCAEPKDLRPIPGSFLMGQM